jgi:hypothetical protein
MSSSTSSIKISSFFSSDGLLPTTSCEITFSGFVVVLSIPDFTVVVVLVV